MSEQKSFEQLVLDAFDVVLSILPGIPGAKYSPEQLKAWGEAKDKFVAERRRVCYHRGSD
jgi:hypothetical protein